MTTAADVFALGAVVAFADMGHSAFEGGPGEGGVSTNERPRLR
ncbi:hypothetical protein ACIRPT_35200 [Streptomyces sp. NPDC101227]